MIPPKTLLPTITPPGTYEQLVDLITTVSELKGRTANRLADRLLSRLGLCGPTRKQVNESKTLLPTIIPPGTYGQLVELITAASQVEGHTAERLADSLLSRLGLYGPPPEQAGDLCSAMFFDPDPADPEDVGWVQCGEEPGHGRHDDLLHKGVWGGRCWRDDHPQAIPAGDEEG